MSHDCRTVTNEIRHTENSTIFTCPVCGKVEEIQWRTDSNARQYAVVSAVLFVLGAGVLCLLGALVPALYLAAFAAASVVWYVVILVLTPTDD